MVINYYSLPAIAANNASGKEAYKNRSRKEEKLTSQHCILCTTTCSVEESGGRFSPFRLRTPPRGRGKAPRVSRGVDCVLTESQFRARNVPDRDDYLTAHSRLHIATFHLIFMRVRSLGTDKQTDV